MLKARKLIAILLLAAAVGQLSGCFFESGDELYALPKPPENYVELQKKIEEVLATGAEYAAPTAGPNSQSVQLVDVDGDGESEAIACFRFSGDKPLKIYIFKRVDAAYQTMAVIEGSGTAINTIQYADLNGDGVSEFIVGWQISTEIHAMAVYSVKDYVITELMVSSYSKLLVFDMNNDGLDDIVLLRFDTSDGVGIAEAYSWQGKGMELNSQVRLSVTQDSLTRVVTGYLQEDVPAVFIAGTYGVSGLITDILASQNGVLTNITMNADTGISIETARYYAVYATDINGDGIMELPQPVPFPTYKDKKTADVYLKIYWRQYSLSAKVTRVSTTYHNNADGWYLVLPDGWEDRITVSRRDTVTGERAIIFSIWTDENTKPVEFLAIYTLTGDNREARSQIGNRFILKKQVEAIYAAEFLAGNNNWSYAISQDELISRFNLIKKEWITGYNS
ncbi:FG-GAP repeat domain-containing protein [Papillibacter cinnamivorans]|uniref:Repeat domain-containing protein n=1 Tax=Papillibacter cinnamivorans DSM 12816 TaxID=1122930 RepID=A0A1W1ZJK3_9FIRM|nr:VCBS repeat-containing protein [Papillibacter cinnamivorans]SMC48258.1 hypothetical protein SAMN02745168_1144 [Papillibacter cinnamivorans DSM 12816]